MCVKNLQNLFVCVVSYVLAWCYLKIGLPIGLKKPICTYLENGCFLPSFAILLKAKEQQRAYELAEIKEVTGYWTKGELNLAVQQGRIEKEAAQKYIREHEKKFQNPLKRRSRYAR